MKTIGDTVDANDIAGSESPGATKGLCDGGDPFNMRKHTAWNSASAKQLTKRNNRCKKRK